MKGEHFAALRNTSDGRECCGGVTGILVDQGRDENRTRAPHEKRVTIRLCRRDRFRADNPAGSTCSVLHDHRLPESGAHLVGDEPRNLVWRAPCRRRHDEFDGPIRVRLRALKYQRLRDKHDQDGEHLLLHSSSRRTYGRQPSPGAATAVFTSAYRVPPVNVAGRTVGAGRQPGKRSKTVAGRTASTAPARENSCKASTRASGSPTQPAVPVSGALQI